MPSVAIIGTRGYPSYYGGFETAIRKLAPYLVDQGWDVTVYSRPGATRPDDPERDPRVRVIQTWGLEKESLSTLTYGFTAARHAAKEKPDVALVMNVANGFWLPALKRARIPTLVNVDGIEWDRAKWGRVAKWLFRTGAKLTAKYASELVVDAVAIGDRWETDFGRRGVFIPYGGTAIDTAPVPLGYEPGGYALVVARFVPENTIPEFLSAAAQISREYPVVIVGSTGYGGELDESARRLAEQHANVRWLGHVNDDGLLFALLNNAGAYFHGHSVGGTNPALVQAMACGAPIVARDTIYNREVLGEQGTYVSPVPEAITRSVQAMISSPYEQERARHNARERSERLYTWDLVCSRYDQTLKELANARPL
ncbi:glycosyltransferase [Microbacterium memoriense]|uniref:Glycosyltransferase n=1 Tax=Microbacterium memoriense TaxID=2978350 RepID=A0ABT2PD45_9MICO|nr:glycosyltransferase [Microbacterium memoriense]MCT9001928.1 glycosyltransferase [Microbacterium memoriense]